MRWDRSAHFDLVLRRIEPPAGQGSEATGRRMCGLQLVTMGGRSSAVGNERTRARRPPGMQEHAGLKFQRAFARSGVAWREARGKRRKGWAASQTETCMRFFALPAFYFTRLGPLARPPPSSRLQRSRRVGQVRIGKTAKCDLLNVRRVA